MALKSRQEKREDAKASVRGFLPGTAEHAWRKAQAWRKEQGYHEAMLKRATRRLDSEKCAVSKVASENAGKRRTSVLEDLSARVKKHGRAAHAAGTEVARWNQVFEKRKARTEAAYASRLKLLGSKVCLGCEKKK